MPRAKEDISETTVHSLIFLIAGLILVIVLQGLGGFRKAGQKKKTKRKKQLADKEV